MGDSSSFPLVQLQLCRTRRLRSCCKTSGCSQLLKGGNANRLCESLEGVCSSEAEAFEMARRVAVPCLLHHSSSSWSSLCARQGAALPASHTPTHSSSAGLTSPHQDKIVIASVLLLPSGLSLQNSINIVVIC